MSGLFIFIALIVVFVLGKFIYDTYLTDNTEKNWEKYRQSNPEDAAKLDMQEARYNYREATAEKQPKMTGKMSTLFPNFIAFFYEIKDDLQMELSKNDDTTLEVRMPILTYGVIQGYTSFTIDLDHENPDSDEYFIRYSVESKKGNFFAGDWLHLNTGDLSVEEYGEFLEACVNEIPQNPLYLQIATGQA